MKMGVWLNLLLAVASLVSLEAWDVDKTSCNCGWMNKGRIVGGKAAKKHQFPWMAALWGKNKVMCGATIITKHHAITAAHCKEDIEMVLVVGLHDTRDYISNRAKDATTIQIDKIINHPGYEKDENFKDDIALVVTKTEIPFSGNVGPACFPEEDIDLDYEKAIVIGWGYDRVSTHQPYILKHVNLTIVSNIYCSLYWGKNLQTPPTQLCGKGDDDEGTCYGDSGGPMVWLDYRTNRYTVVGVPSFGLRGCDFPPPAVFTDVRKYIPWIQETIKENKPDEVCVRLD